MDSLDMQATTAVVARPQEIEAPRRHTSETTAAPRPTIEDLNRWMVVGFDRLYGLEFDACSDREVSAHVCIAEQHKQPIGIVHGGLYATIAESVATIAAIVSVAGEGNTAIGLSNNTSFIRPISQGAAHAVGRRRHSGRTTQVWDVEISDDDGRPCAVTRVTVAIRPQHA
jgi:1,4-dihydroxy-2-naphthoyl-CoA hydrolase